MEQSQAEAGSFRDGAAGVHQIYCRPDVVSAIKRNGSMTGLMISTIFILLVLVAGKSVVV